MNVWQRGTQCPLDSLVPLPRWQQFYPPLFLYQCPCKCCGRGNNVWIWLWPSEPWKGLGSCGVHGPCEELLPCRVKSEPSGTVWRLLYALSLSAFLVPSPSLHQYLGFPDSVTCTSQCGPFFTCVCLQLSFPQPRGSFALFIPPLQPVCGLPFGAELTSVPWRFLP